MKKAITAAVHPGEILLGDFMEPAGLSVSTLAAQLRMPAGRLNGIVHEAQPINADTAVKLARHFGTSFELWLNMQRDYDRRVAVS